MQFLVLGYDGSDSEAVNRRMAVRDAHLALGDKLRDEGKLLYAVAMLSDEGQMCGSVMVGEFSTREELDQWLAEEPYVVGKVWQRVEVIPAKVGPSFAHLKVDPSVA
ncbi:YciI family protein [bacterium]|nr:YciI family protein [bacterium]